MYIEVVEKERRETLPVDRLVGLAPRRLSLEELVPGVAGRAFDVKSFYRAWTRCETEPTHLQVAAKDEFAATIPWEQAGQAVFLYEQDGAPLQKGGPLRLYVPDGSSACLNVKSVVNIVFAHEPKLGDAAVFGYKNRLTAEDLRKKP